MKVCINEKKEFAFGVNGKENLAGVSVSITLDGDSLETPMRLEKAEESKGKYLLSYKNEQNLLSAEAEIQIFAKSAIRQKTRVVCSSEHTLTQLAGANIYGVCFDKEGLKDRLCDGSILIHYCISRWQGEGQWRKATPEDLGIYPMTKHGWERIWYRFDSLSSWSTATYYPLLIIEDKKKNECWFFETEGGHSWFLEIYGYGGEDICALSVKMGGADEKSGFAKKLNVGEGYESCSCVYGVTEGGFEEAVKALTAYKRATSLVKGGCPLTFNDYMNCNWTNESEKTLLPLIDKAAELGVEVFCLDDGWQETQGLWYPANEKFGDKGLQGIFDYIKAKGMKAGVWFEFETVPLQVGQMLGTDDCFLFRNDGVVAPNRPLANMRSERLLTYLNERVDALYNMGVRFIKNDHNNTEYIGSTMYGESAGEGLENNAKAFLSFIDGIVKRHPDLIIENCGSGAMRSDNGTLRHFHIQSTSDQENYLSYTSVLAGSLALMPPEKAGIWCYPYPLSFNDRMNLELSNEQVKSYKNGEQTICNVVNGFMGCMYLSGKIHQADEDNFSLLKEGVDLYKDYAAFIRQSYPVFPRGMIRLSDRTYNAVGLMNDEKTMMLLAVWNLSDKKQNVVLDLKKYGMSSCELLYPSKKSGFSYVYKDNQVACSFENGHSARLFLLKRDVAVVDFILENIDKTTKSNIEKSGEDTLIPLPYPFTTPCVEGMFQEIYYWDTYFTQKALYLTSRNEQALHNVKNFVFLLEKYGKIPNGNRTYYLKNSQPPFFGLMLKDLMKNMPNVITAEYAFKNLEREYAFWMKNRQAKNGLNHYNRDMEDETNPDTIRWYKERTGIELENTADNCRSIWSEGESGWDFCPRFDSACTHYNAIDLNCLLYVDELLLSSWAKQVDDINAFERYQRAAAKRKERMWEYMRGKDGVWYDYNYDKKTLSKVISCASLFPFFVGLDTDTSAFEKTIAVLERDFGVVASQSERKTYQWAEPNGWAPLHYIAVAAADSLGLKETARRLAKKYLSAMDGIFEKTGRLWEKYNAETGDMSITSEYVTPEMLGWTAGVYMAFYHYQKNGYQKLI